MKYHANIPVYSVNDPEEFSQAHQYLFPWTSNNYEEDEGPKSSSKESKSTRWGRANDRQLFKTINEWEANGKLNIAEVLKIRKRLTPAQEEVFQNLSMKVLWRGQIRHLVIRIQSLFKRSKFSVREFKLMRRILRTQYKDREIDYDKLLENFPGKTKEYLVKECEEYIELKREEEARNKMTQELL